MTPAFDITDWQLFVYILFSLLILFSAWQGWQHGMGRSILILVGVGIGYIAGKALGFIIFDLYESLIPYPRPFVKLITNIIFGFLVYFLFVAASIFMFKSTRKQPGTKEKLISGIGGVVFGICNGLVVAVVISIGIRLMGITNMAIPPEPGSIEFRQKQDVFLPEHLKENAKISVNLSRAILNPPIKKWVKLANPVSENYFTLLINLKVLSERKDLLTQFIEHEDVQKLLHTPEIAVVIENSTIPRLLEQGNFYALIRSESFLELYKRESCAALLTHMNWTQITSQIIENSDLANHPDL